MKSAVRTLRDWRPKLRFRERLTLAFTALVATAGAAMMLVVYLFMRTVPSYAPAQVARRDLDETTVPNGIVSDAIVLISPIDILNTSLIVSAVALVLLTGVGAALAWWIAGRMLRPLQAISRAAEVAGAGSFTHRIGFEGPHDEIRELSERFDEMLARLDEAFHSHQRFAANASHELRTPIAATQTMLEIALADPDTDLRELRQVAERVFETNRRNGQMVEAILDLAEIGQRPLVKTPVQPGPLITDAVTRLAGEIAERQLTVTTCLDDATVIGGPVLLRQAVSNLMTNAVRHNLDGGSIHIALISDPDSVQIRVENTGPPLSATQLEVLLEPFARGSGRTSSPTRRGHGLGLALVSSIARAHDAVLSLEPRVGGGLVASLVLRPCASAGASAPSDSHATCGDGDKTHQQQ